MTFSNFNAWFHCLVTGKEISSTDGWIWCHEWFAKSEIQRVTWAQQYSQQHQTSKRTLFFFHKSLQHHRKPSTAVQCLWKASSEVLPLRFMPLCNILLCQVTHYANALFTVNVTVSRQESQWGLGVVASYQDRGGGGRENKLWKNCQTMWQMTLLLCLSFYGILR